MTDTNKKKIQNWLMLDLLGRKIRLRTQRLREEHGRAECRTVEDWLKTATEVLRTLNTVSRGSS